MNNFTVASPYTKKIPSGTLTNVQLTNPTNVQIQWPSPSGNTQPNKRSVGKSILAKIFG